MGKICFRFLWEKRRINFNKKRKYFFFKFKHLQTRKKEKGCTVPLYGKKSKCIIKIVPQEEKGESFQMDKKCIKTKTNID